MSDSYYVVELSIHRIGESYQLELSHAEPGNSARIMPMRAGASFSLDALTSKQAVSDDYGRELGKQLFSDEGIKQRFLQIETSAQAKDCSIRLSLSIDPSAQELHALRWELLRHPDTDAMISTSETLLFSRFMLSRDWRPIKLSAKSDLQALIVVSAPTPDKLARRELGAVDFEGEVARVKTILEGIDTKVLGGPSGPVTIDSLFDALREGVDILYLVSHGMFGRQSGVPALVFQAENGDPKIIKAELLTERIAELRKRPRLAVLASCQSAGDGGALAPGQRTTVQATLAGRLAEAGIPAVVAMQGYISMTTVEQMMPVFFRELLRDGQIDRALAVARGRVRGRDDVWMPALFMRLSTGKIWYTPGFESGKGQEVWRNLLDPIRHGKVVPILGPRLLEAAHGTAHETAMRLAAKNSFPLAAYHHDDLPRVTEYMSVMESRYNVVQAYKTQLLENLADLHRDWLPAEELPPQNPKPRLGKLLGRVANHLRETDPADPFRVLAELPASVYVTTNHDPLLSQALVANEREPQRVVTRWRYHKPPVIADEESASAPTVKAPLVYHAFGAFGKDDSLVLTEDDYFDYLIATSAKQLIPPAVEGALVDNSLLFLGFRLTDWHFRVLFRLMMNLPGKALLKQYCHVAVQLDPDMQLVSDVERAKEYLAEYFGQEAKIDIFWGSATDFLTALHEELAKAGDLTNEDESEDDDDEWNF